MHGLLKLIFFFGFVNWVNVKYKKDYFALGLGVLWRHYKLYPEISTKQSIKV